MDQARSDKSSKSESHEAGFFRPKVAILIGVLALLLFVAYLFDFPPFGGSTEKAAYRTKPLEEKNLVVSIAASGTLEPEEVIDVGAQVAGQIVSFGTDSTGQPVDFRSQVKRGDILAQIDSSVYTIDVAQATAELKTAEAELKQARAKFLQAERDWKRAEPLSSALAKTSIDNYEATYRVAEAAVAVAEAKIAQTQARLDKAKRSLEYTTIRSPIDGVVIDRRVNIGQTVVASLNAPSLFLMAKDLRRMEVWVSVNEADIGSIRPGQEVTFTVDAFPGREFTGLVKKTRLNATMTQNVVTYLVEVSTENPDATLLPYLTANVKFVLDRFDIALVVPNAALRWRPSNALPSDDTRRSIWVLEGDEPREYVVRVLGKGELESAVEGEGLHKGLEVIVGEAVAEVKGAAQGATNPFAPPPFRGRRGAAKAQGTGS